MKRTGPGVLRKRTTDPEPAQKLDRVQMTVAEMIRYIRNNVQKEHIAAVEHVLDCTEDDSASLFGDDVIEW